MRPCKTCGGEIKPIQGGKVRSAMPCVGDLGVGTAPMLDECLDCLMKTHMKNKGVANA